MFEPTIWMTRNNKKALSVNKDLLIYLDSADLFERMQCRELHHLEFSWGKKALKNFTPEQSARCAQFFAHSVQSSGVKKVIFAIRPIFCRSTRPRIGNRLVTKHAFYAHPKQYLRSVTWYLLIITNMSYCKHFVTLSTLCSNALRKVWNNPRQKETQNLTMYSPLKWKMVL